MRETTRYQTKINDHYPNLSASLQKVAKFVLDQPGEIAIRSARQVGKSVGVSETSVIRLAHALGYSGYSELQKEVREHVYTVKSGLETYRHSKHVAESGMQAHVQNVMNQDRAHIAYAMARISEDDFNKAVRKLAEADHILVTGMRSSFSMAHWFAFTLDLIRGKAQLFQPGMDDAILRMAEMTDHSVFVVFSFHRYSNEGLRLAAEAKRTGAFVIGITDSTVAPIHNHADLVLTVHLPVQSTLDAAPVCFSLLNALASAVLLNDPESFAVRKDVYESYQLEDLFY